ncbi:MAG TPA: phosphate ABC transporter substrate-binding protein PstS [Bacteroidales bacterium]|nr:phosphate ABC transporter substrate-binding protein PstS [Bacteroidales bacterium]
MKQFFTLLLIVAAITSCNNGGKPTSGKEGKVSVTAAGATFPMPFYNLAFRKYTEKSGIDFNYGGIGSGGGIRSLADKVVDFGASDAFLSDKELSDFQAEVVHIPTCLGAVVLAYNLPGIDSLKVTPSLLADIFLGNITKWNDKALKQVNPGADLPDLKITVVYRSDGSGTTFIFSDYMTKVSSAWAEKIGTGKSLNWPVGLGAKGNPGVAGTISQTKGAIGYIGSEYAFAQKISYAKLQNKSGKFIEPGISSVSAAARAEIPADSRVMVTDSPDPEAYPISGFTWIILYREQSYNGRTQQQAKAVVDFLEWLVGPEGQAIAESVNYAPLPSKVSETAKKILGTVTYNGQPIKQ